LNDSSPPALIGDLPGLGPRAQEILARAGEPWLQVAKRHRTSLLLAVDDLERSAR
jgi:hypothetical protein